MKKEFPQLSALFEGDEQAVEEILSCFVLSTENDMDALAACVKEGNFEKAQRLSHKIHPFFNQLDAERLCAALHKMDTLRGEDESAYPEWKEELTKTIGEIRQFIGGL